MELLLSLWLYMAQSWIPTEQAILHVYVLYDPDHDGELQGVGEGVRVDIFSASQNFIIFTDKTSHVGLSLLQGFVTIRAYPKSTRLFYTWVCERAVVIDDPLENIPLVCFERFFLQLPFAQK